MDETKVAITGIIAATLVLLAILFSASRPDADMQACMKAGKSWVISEHSSGASPDYECR